MPKRAAGAAGLAAWGNLDGWIGAVGHAAAIFGAPVIVTTGITGTSRATDEN